MIDLNKAYEETHFIVHHQPPFTLKVGQHSSQLDALLLISGMECAAFITAWNPMSQALSDEENHQRQQHLMAELDRRGLSYLPGIGQHPSNDWPGEESLLVMNMQLEAACAMAKQWEQLAFVWVKKGHPVQLIDSN